MSDAPRKTLRELAAAIPLQTALAGCRGHLAASVQEAVREWSRLEVTAQRARSDVLASYPRAYCAAAPCARKAVYTAGPQPQRLSALRETEAHAWISAAAVVREANYRAALEPLSEMQRAAMESIIRKVRER